MKEWRKIRKEDRAWWIKRIKERMKKIIYTRMNKSMKKIINKKNEEWQSLMNKKNQWKNEEHKIMNRSLELMNKRMN